MNKDAWTLIRKEMQDLLPGILDLWEVGLAPCISCQPDSQIGKARVGRLGLDRPSQAGLGQAITTKMVKTVKLLGIVDGRRDGRRDHWELGGRAFGDLALELSGIGGKRGINLFYHKKPKEYRWEKGGRDHWGPGA